MSQVNRTCKTCGKQYFYCTNCDKTLNSPQWMLMWHDENCKKVFETVSDYAQKRISKEDAKSKIEACNLKVYYTFKEIIRNYIDEILAEDVVVDNSSTDFPMKRSTRNQRRRK